LIYGIDGLQNRATNNYQMNNMLEKDAFLKLLVTELKYQDPVEPMKDRDFIAQMAQFSSLEQLQNMNNTNEYLLRLNQMAFSFNTVSMIGKKIAFQDDLGEIREEVVEGISFEGNIPYLDIGEEMLIPFDMILRIKG